MPLPTARGPLSDRLFDALRHDRDPGSPVEIDTADPYGDDLHVALYVAYELHYAGFAGVAADREWDPRLLAYRADLERRFLDALRRDTAVDDTARADDEMAALLVEPIDGDGASYRLRDNGTWDQYRDYFALRSMYHLKEADPHAWAIPRLRGPYKAAYVAVEFDEFGAGRGAAMHQELYADLLAAADLDPSYLGYLDVAPSWALAPVNMLSCFGLHRSLRGAIVGQLAAGEITSSPGSARLLAGLERLDAPEPCKHFYREHVEADAVHEQVMRTDVVAELLTAEPELEPDVVLGIRGFLYLDDLFDAGVQQAWDRGGSALHAA
ncbi:iron-containing redox enzyme family protein [Gordonia sinesedis]